MSLSEIIIKIIGIVLAVVGFGLLLSCVGLSLFGIGIAPAWLALILGFVFLGAGIGIIRGAQPNL